MESPTGIPRVVASQVTGDNYYKGIFLSPTLKTPDSGLVHVPNPGSAKTPSLGKQSGGRVTSVMAPDEPSFKTSTEWDTQCEGVLAAQPRRAGTKELPSGLRLPSRLPPKVRLFQCAQRQAWIPDSGHLVIFWRVTNNLVSEAPFLVDTKGLF